MPPCSLVSLYVLDLASLPESIYGHLIKTLLFYLSYYLIHIISQFFQGHYHLRMTVSDRL